MGQPITSEHVDKLRKDYRKLMVIYRAAGSDPGALREARGIFDAYHSRLDSWIDTLLPETRSDAEKALAKAVRNLSDPYWDLFSERTQGPKALERYRRAMAVLFSALDTVVRANPREAPAAEEVYTIGPLTVVVDNRGAISKNWWPKLTNDLMKTLPGTISRVRAAGLGEVLEGLTIRLDVKEKGGRYVLGIEEIVLGFMGMGGNGTIEHELGHRWWAHHITEVSRARWEDGFKGNKADFPDDPNDWDGKPDAEEVFAESFAEWVQRGPRALSERARQLFVDVMRGKVRMASEG